MASTAMDDMNLAQDQIKMLEDNFNKIGKHPTGLTLTLIACECGLTEEETQKWFQLRNAKWRQAEGLPAKVGTVLD